MKILRGLSITYYGASGIEILLGNIYYYNQIYDGCI